MIILQQISLKQLSTKNSRIKLQNDQTQLQIFSTNTKFPNSKIQTKISILKSPNEQNETK